MVEVLVGQNKALSWGFFSAWEVHIITPMAYDLFHSKSFFSVIFKVCTSDIICSENI